MGEGRGGTFGRLRERTWFFLNVAESLTSNRKRRHKGSALAECPEARLSQNGFFGQIRRNLRRQSRLVFSSPSQPKMWEAAASNLAGRKHSSDGCTFNIIVIAMVATMASISLNKRKWKTLTRTLGEDRRFCQKRVKAAVKSHSKDSKKKQRKWKHEGLESKTHLMKTTKT